MKILSLKHQTENSTLLLMLFGLLVYGLINVIGGTILSLITFLKIPGISV